MLANAYSNAKAKNEIEKNSYFSNSINLLRESLETDSTNLSADSLMSEIKQDHFKDLIQKGKDDYSKARRTGNVNYYFSAEYYFQQAAKFDPRNYEIMNYLHNIQVHTLPVLNYKDGFSMAIVSKKYKNNELILDLVVKNYLQEKIPLKLENFELTDSEGNVHKVFQRGMDAQALFGEKCIQDTMLTPANSGAEGLLVFSLTEETKLSHLSYKVSNSRVYKKYFP